MKIFFPAFVASALLLLADSAVNALNVRMDGVNYNSRKGPDWAPDADKCKTQEQVLADMKSIKTISDKVRIYSLVDCNQAELVLRAADTAGLKVHLGIWTTEEVSFLDTELAKFGSLVDNGLIDSRVVGMQVGSETIYRKDVTAAEAIQYLDKTRKYLSDHNVNVPLTIADVIDTYYAHPELIDAVDYISVNQFSFWEKSDVNEGMAVTLDRLRDLRKSAVAKNKRLLISEIGWSSGGEDDAAGVASPANQAKFFSDFFQSARAIGLEYYWFMAFDSQWRVTNGAAVVEANFGVFNENESMKDNFRWLTIGWRDPRVLRNAGTNMYLSEDSGEVYMSSASNDWLVKEQQVWFFDDSTSAIRSKSGDRCLDAYENKAGGTVHVYRCMDNEGNQKWKFDSASGRLQHAKHANLCLDVDPAQNNKVQLYWCSDNNVNQQFSVVDPADMSSGVRFYTMESEKPFAQLVANGDAVGLGYGGNGVAGSVWHYDAKTHLVKAKGTNKCIDAYEAKEGGRVHLWDCNSQEKNQFWTLDESTNQLRHQTHTGFCLDADRAANNGAGNIQLWGCHLNNNNQVWRKVSEGATAATVHSANTDNAFLQPTSEDTIVGAAFSGSSNQHWFWDADANRLISKINGQCMDAYEAKEGGRVHTYSCMSGEDNHSWNYDATNQIVKHAKHSGFCLAFNNLSNKLLQLKSCNSGDTTQRIKIESA